MLEIQRNSPERCVDDGTYAGRHAVFRFHSQKRIVSSGKAEIDLRCSESFVPPMIKNLSAEL
jgi:hypothetical protein